jgi:uncharacterized membrane protein YqjE
MEPTKALDPAGASDALGNETGLLQDVRFLWHELRSMVHDQLTLAALETRLAGESLVQMLIAGVLIAVLLISAWLGLMAAGIVWLVSLGFVAALAILGAVAANLLAAGILYTFLRRRSRHLQFPSTLRSLRPLPVKTQAEAKP